MKKIYMYAAAILCGLAMTTSCTKEDIATSGIPEGALEIFAEGSGTKTTVSGTSVKWAVGDGMRFYPSSGSSVGGTVQQNGDHWYVVKEGSEPFAFTAPFNTYYPSSIATEDGHANLTCINDAFSTTVVLPKSYNSSFDGDRQVIALPMAAASAANATHIEMKHISAGINVNVKNAFTGDTVLFVDSVKVTSSEVNLSGQLILRMRTNEVPAIVSRGSTGTHSVTVKFSTPLALSMDESRCIQVPVLPGSEDLGAVTINVYTHLLPRKYGIVDIFTYERSKASFGALGRNQVMASPEIAIARGGDNITRRERGDYTIKQNEKRVVFSPGNLQYQASTGSWRFALNQYDYVGNADSGNVYVGGVKCNNALKSASYDGWIDLFGWGTWTGSNPDPTKNSTNYNDYAWNSNDFSKESELADVTQRSYNWRTLDGTSNNDSYDWYILINDRSASTIGGTANARYLKATVDGHRCLILFPDQFVWNASTMGDVPTTCNKANNSFTHSLTLTQWEALENAGAVLLPAAGNYMTQTDATPGPALTGKQICYWTSTPVVSSNNKLFGGALRTFDSRVELNTLERENWCSVRLVRDAN